MARDGDMVRRTMTKLIALFVAAALGAGGVYVAIRPTGPSPEEFCAHMFKLLAAEGSREVTPEKFQQCVESYPKVFANVANTPLGKILIKCSMDAETASAYLRCNDDWLRLQPR